VIFSSSISKLTDDIRSQVYLNALLASLNARSKFREVSYNNTETIVFGTLRSPVTSYPSRKAYMDGDGTGTHTFEVFPASNQSVLDA
jgi:hypothetical protein